MRDASRAVAEDRAVAETATGSAVRDRLLLAFAELAMYGIATEEDVAAEPEWARAEIAALLRTRSPYGLGSYVYRRRAADAGLDAGAPVPLYTSGPEVDRAVIAACAHHGLSVRPGPGAGVLLASDQGRADGAIQPDPVQ